MDEGNRRRVNFYKALIISFVAFLLIFPWGLSITALAKVSRLQEQLELLTARMDEEPDDTSDMTSQRSRLADAVADSEHGAGLLDERRTVYLTFDDGPSKYTQEILDILHRYDVPATFFVQGRTDSQSIRMYQSIVANGHSLGIHSYSHKYESIYASASACLEDIERLRQLLLDSTGVSSTIYRFPGGSSNTIASRALIAEVAYRLAEEGIRFFDWNIDSGDGRFWQPSVEQIVSNVVNGARGKKQAVVLMHDDAAKCNTVKALPQVIEALQSEGYVFARLTSETDPVQHRVYLTTLSLNPLVVVEGSGYRK